jgi:hypothetical protein
MEDVQFCKHLLTSGVDLEVHSRLMQMPISAHVGHAMNILNFKREVGFRPKELYVAAIRALFIELSRHARHT